jgi:hypothetical protein
MADGQYFRDLGQRFEDLRRSRDPREELQALYIEQPQACYAAECGVTAKMLMRSGEPEIVYRYAREASRAGIAVQEGNTVRRQYTLSGPLDPTLGRSLEDQWSALATLGAAAASLKLTSRDGWLDLLRARSAYFSEITGDCAIEGERFETTGGMIRRLCRASAEMCLTLESEAPFNRPAATSMGSPQSLSSGRRFDKRAAWLKAEMDKRGITTAHGLENLGGPNHKTCRKILDGHPVRDDEVLPKIIEALNFKRGFPTVSREHIPGS